MGEITKQLTAAERRFHIAKLRKAVREERWALVALFATELDLMDQGR